METHDCCAVPPPEAPQAEAKPPSATLSDYKPLIIIIAIIFLAAFCIHTTGYSFMHAFMGLFLTVFALFKLFDVKGFAEGFQQYDLIAQRVPLYAKAYPFIELTLGLFYLAYVLPMLTNILTLLIMGTSAAGIYVAMRSKRAISCACLGTMLKVPLGTISLVESSAMAVMALVMVIF